MHACNFKELTNYSSYTGGVLQEAVHILEIMMRLNDNKFPADVRRRLVQEA